MATSTLVRLTIGFNDPAFDDEVRDRTSRRLLFDLRESPIVQSSQLAVAHALPPNSKAVGSFIPGFLTAEINGENAKALFSFLRQRLSGQSIEMEVEANGKRLKVRASNCEELETAISAAQKFIQG